MSNKQNVESEALNVAYTLLKFKPTEKFKLKIKLTVIKIQQSILYKICRIFSASKHRLNFENPFTGSGEISSSRRDLFEFCFQNNKKTGKALPYIMIDN